MFKHPLKTLAISAALAAALMVSASAASMGGAQVKSDSLILRSEPSTAAPAITAAPFGSFVVVGGRVNNEWYKVVYRGAIGYMPSEYLNYSENLYESSGFGVVRGSDVCLKEGPSYSSEIVGIVQQGARMDILGVSGQWYKVSGGGTSGYIHSDCFALNGGVADRFPGTESAGQVIVDTAMKYMGVPYVWGGTSTGGFDCSGLVYYVYKECGYTINRTAASIYTNGEYVEKSALQPGDAVCFSSYSNSIGHVGIYIGNGQFIHASSGSGCVIISELSSNYYLTRYVGSRRIV